MIDLTYFGLGVIVGHHIARLTRKNDDIKIPDTIIVFIGFAIILANKMFAMFA